MSAAPVPSVWSDVSVRSHPSYSSDDFHSAPSYPPTSRFIRHSPHASTPPHFVTLSSPTPRHQHSPSHSHMTLKDVSHYPSRSTSSSHLPPPSRDAPPFSHSLTLPSHVYHHHRGMKSHSADFHSPSSLHLPSSPSRTHSPRNNGVVHLSASALEFSPTLAPSQSPPRPPSQLSAGPPLSPHSATSTSSSSSSSSSHQPRALSRQSSAGGRTSTATTTASLPSSSSQLSSCGSSPSLTSIPLFPCDDFDHTLNLSIEQPSHLPYLLSFRTSVCSHWSSMGPAHCPCVGATCFASHSTRPRRRRPTLLNGRYNYLPTRCRYVRGGGGGDGDDDCPQGVHCRFAHATEEVIYHPSKYKTQLCQHRTDEDGACQGYGQHCAKGTTTPHTHSSHHITSHHSHFTLPTLHRLPLSCTLSHVC